MHLTSILLVLFSAVLALATPLEKRNTPKFYLVATSANSAFNLKPVLVGSGSGSDLSLTTGSVTKFNLNDRNGLTIGDGTDFAVADFPFTSTGSCDTTGPIARIAVSTTNKCAQSGGFYISSYDQNSQLGAKLVFNWQGGFFACSGGVIKYAKTGTPSGCSAVNLWTVPAA